MRLTGKLLLIFLTCFSYTTIQAQVYDLVIAQDGSGDSPSFQRALRQIPQGQTEPFLIFVKAGNYREKVNFSSLYPNVSIIGESKETVRISWEDYSGDENGNSTGSSYTFLTESDNFYLENVTIANTAGNVGQAVALHTTGERQVFKNCDLLGFQDTYYAQSGTQYHLNMYIEGATDFIFGDGTSVLDTCEIHCLEGGQYITAPADTKFVTEVEGESFYHGLLFRASDITAEAGVADNSYFLGRPWQPNSSSVFINCTLGPHIRDIGWSDWNNENHLSAVFAEYQSVDPSGNLIDVSGRTDWSYQLTSEQVSNYYNLDYFLGGWNPIPKTIAPSPPTNLAGEEAGTPSGMMLSWEVVEEAIGYVIYKNDSAAGFAETNEFLAAEVSGGDSYKVKSVGSSGALSGFSNEVIATVVTGLEKPGALQYTLYKNRLEAAEPLNISIYNLSGRIILKSKQVKYLDLTGLQRGIYLFYMENNLGETIILKTAI